MSLKGQFLCSNHLASTLTRESCEERHLEHGTHAVDHKDQQEEESKLDSQDKIFKSHNHRHRRAGEEEMKESKRVNTKSTKKNWILDFRDEKTNH